jgi:hypothetical protein
MSTRDPRADGADLLDHCGSLPPLDHYVAPIFVVAAQSLRRDVLEDFPGGNVCVLAPFAGNRGSEHGFDAAQGGAGACMGTTVPQRLESLVRREELMISMLSLAIWPNMGSLRHRGRRT